MNLFTELNRRNVFRVGIAYVVLSWLLLQMGDLLFDLMGLPDWGNRIVLVILLLGFPVALVFSWIYELTPEGVKKESEIDRSASITPETGRKLDIVTLLAVVGVAAFAIMDRYPDAESPRQPVPAPAITAAADDGVEPKDAVGSDELSIAVLPFVNMSPDAENEYFADGVAEEILNRISKAEGLRVISRSSAFSFKGRNESIPEVARQLNVNHVLEGSVRRAGDRVRVTAQLIQVRDDAHLWSETYDRTLEDIFAVQDEIANAIAEALELTLGLDEHQQASDLGAYELVLKGRGRVGRRTAAGIDEAISLFTEATQLAPDYAEAHGQLAMAYLLQHAWNYDAHNALERLEEAARRSLALDPENVPALVALASHRMYTVRLDEADRLFQQALAINANSVQANNWYGDYLTIVMRSEEAVHYERRAVELDPLLAVHRQNLASALWLDGRLDEAIEECERALEIDPDYPILATYGLMLAREGRVEQLRSLVAAHPIPPELARFLELVAIGHKEEAAAFLDTVGDVSKFSRQYGQQLKGILYVAAGQYDEAVDGLDVGAKALGDAAFPFDVPTDPEILRQHPRYAAWWRQPPRDGLLKARGHWIWGDEQ